MERISMCEKCWLRYSSYCMGCRYWATGIVDEYDLDRLRELVQADREGRCMVVPSDYDGEMFKIWKGQILSSRRFVNNIKELGKTVFLTREEAQAALRREQE